MPLVFGVVGRSGSGKTTLIEAMLPWLRRRNLTVSVIKHCHHAIELEPPGKDSARFRRAGAHEVMAISPQHCALIQDMQGRQPPDLEVLLARLGPADLVLVEGFKRDAIPRLEVYRPDRGLLPLYPYDAGILAIATDATLPTRLPCLPLNDPPLVAAFICRTLGLMPRADLPA